MPASISMILDWGWEVCEAVMYQPNTPLALENNLVCEDMITWYLSDRLELLYK